MKNKIIRYSIWVFIHPFIWLWYRLMLTLYPIYDYKEPTSHCSKCKIHFRNNHEGHCTKMRWNICHHCYNELSTEDKLKTANDFIEKTNKLSSNFVLFDDKVVKK